MLYRFKFLVAAAQTPPSPTGGRKSGQSRRATNGQGALTQQQQQQQQVPSRGHSNGGRVKGVPQSFGYVKRAGSSSHQSNYFNLF